MAVTSPIYNRDLDSASKRKGLLLTWPALLAAYAILNFSGVLNEPISYWVTDLAWTGFSLAAGIRCLVTASKLNEKRLRLSWILFGLAAISWFIGMLIWDYNELIRGVYLPYPSIADIFFGFFAVFFIGGTFYYCSEFSLKLFTLKQLGNLGIIISALTVIFVIVLYQTIVRSEHDQTFMFASLFHAVGHTTAFVFALVCYWLYINKIYQHIFLILLLASGMHAYADLSYAYSLIDDSYNVASYFNIVWLIAFALQYWAAFEQQYSSKNKTVHESALTLSDQILESFVPALAILCILIIVIFHIENLTIDVYSIIIPIGIAFVFFLAMREYFVERDSNYLQSELFKKNNELFAQIHNHKQTEETLKFTQFAMDNMGDAAYWVDKNARLFYVNDAACDALGYSREELLGMHIPDIDPDFSMVDWDDYWSNTQRNELSSFQTNHRRKNGTVFPVEVRSSHIHYHGEEYRCTFARDITEQKQAEEALKITKFAIDHASDAIYWFDKDGRFIYVNDAACHLLGYSKDEFMQMFLWDIDHDVLPEKYPKIWQGLRKDKQRFFEACHHTKDGIAIPIEVTINILEYHGKEYNCTIARDISERKKTEQVLRSSEERYRALYDDNPSMFFTVGSDLNVSSVNKFGASELGYDIDDLLGKSVLEVFHEDDRSSAKEYLQSCLLKPNEVQRWNLRKLRRDGSMLWVREIARTVRDSNDKLSILIVCEDITEAHSLSEKLSHQASHDALTGLVNRREFEYRLNRVLESAREDFSEHVVCYMDLDQFKVINDACGHIAGDELLRQLSEVLKKHVRKRDTLARLGGDEFGLLMEHCTLADARRVANTIRDEIQDFRFIWEERLFNIGVSIGVVPVSRYSGTMTEVLRQVDAACYAAKDAGRNRIHIYHSDDMDMIKRHVETQWVGRINEALENDNFVLYAQPIALLDNHNYQISHYELLVRMLEEDDTIVPPAKFLNPAERYNLASRIDRYVVNTAFKMLCDQPQFLARTSFCSINLSAQSLAEPEFLDFVIEKINAFGSGGEKFCFEITETAAISNMAEAINFISTLKELGCSFALDDFGSGLSSFAYLKNLGVDYLKIDGIFVKDIVDDPIDFAMVKSINEIGHVMGIKTIAEFVENDAIIEKLKGIGVNYVQGYGIGKPVLLSEILDT